MRSWPAGTRNYRYNLRAAGEIQTRVTPPARAPRLGRKLSFGASHYAPLRSPSAGTTTMSPKPGPEPLGVPDRRRRRAATVSPPQWSRSCRETAFSDVSGSDGPHPVQYITENATRACKGSRRRTVSLRAFLRASSTGARARDDPTPTPGPPVPAGASSASTGAVQTALGSGLQCWGIVPEEQLSRKKKKRCNSNPADPALLSTRMASWKRATEMGEGYGTGPSGAIVRAFTGASAADALTGSALLADQCAVPRRPKGERRPWTLVVVELSR